VSTKAHAKLESAWPEGNDDVVGTSISGSGSSTTLGGRSRPVANFSAVVTRLATTDVAATSRKTCARR
jgi:hypothetical protein